MKTKKILLFLAILSTGFSSIAQTNTFPSSGSAGIGITTPHASALLEIAGTSKGMLVPRMTKNQRDAIASPATGLLIYQTNSNPGFYYYTGPAWNEVTPKAKGWNLNGNAGTDTATNFIGTTDDQPLVFKVNNQRAGLLDHNSSSAFGFLSLVNNTTGYANTAMGIYALRSNTTGSYNNAGGSFSLYNNNIGNSNTATGVYSLFLNTAGNNNTAFGVSALQSNTSGSNNTAMGNFVLVSNTTGYSNVAIGTNALFKNTVNSNLVAVGDSVLYNNISGSNEAGQFNCGIGSKALYTNTTGSYNTAAGSNALISNTTGTFNSAIGTNALRFNTTGNQNTAGGVATLVYNTTGSYNTGFGINALWFNNSGNNNTGFGNRALFSNSSGGNLTVVGGDADVNADGYFGSSAFGANALITASYQVRIGNSSVTSIGGYKGWTNISDRRVKKNIKENVPGLAFIKLLKPVTYSLDLDAADNIMRTSSVSSEKDKDFKLSSEDSKAREIQQKIICTGFIAQDVELAAKKIGYDFDGVDIAKNDKDLYGLRYSEFVVPLVKAVQELSEQNEKLKNQNDEFEKRIIKLEALVSVHPVNKNPAVYKTNASLEQNIPNPFNHFATINYYLPEKYSSAKIIVTDKIGKVLKQEVLSGMGKGTVTIDALGFTAGIYQYSLYTDGKLITTKQMNFIK